MKYLFVFLMFGMLSCAGTAKPIEYYSDFDAIIYSGMIPIKEQEISLPFIPNGNSIVISNFTTEVFGYNYLGIKVVGDDVNLCCEVDKFNCNGNIKTWQALGKNETCFFNINNKMFFTIFWDTNECNEEKCLILILKSFSLQK